MSKAIILALAYLNQPYPKIVTCKLKLIIGSDVIKREMNILNGVSFFDGIGSSEENYDFDLCTRLRSKFSLGVIPYTVVSTMCSAATRSRLNQKC